MVNPLVNKDHGYEKMNSLIIILLSFKTINS
jgi:hypothetical protein